MRGIVASALQDYSRPLIEKVTIISGTDQLTDFDEVWYGDDASRHSGLRRPVPDLNV